MMISTPQYTLDEFLQQTSQQDHGGEAFQLESPYMLEVNVRELVWTKLGAMVAYRGNLKFAREGAFEHGIGSFLKRAFTGEMNPMMKVTGQGTVYLADYCKHITLLKLQGESINVNGNDLLAFAPSLQWDITLLRRIAGMLAGGLFSVKLSGTGMLALCTHGTPTTLRCTAQSPLCTDPNATVAWSGHLAPELKTDITMRTLLGRGSGESLQMQFTGDGFIIVQPYEERGTTTSAEA